MCCVSMTEDYCGDGEEVKPHPYLPCYTFVTCEGGTVHLHTCPPGDGLCFNATSRNCSIPAPGRRDRLGGLVVKSSVSGAGRSGFNTRELKSWHTSDYHPPPHPTPSPLVLWDRYWDWLGWCLYTVTEGGIKVDL